MTIAEAAVLAETVEVMQQLVREVGRLAERVDRLETAVGVLIESESTLPVETRLEVLGALRGAEQ